MSLEDLKGFGKKCAEDPVVRTKAKKIGIDNLDGLAKYAKEFGFTITKKDFEDLAKELKKSDQLSEEQLEKIAGGVLGVTATAAMVMVGPITSLYNAPVTANARARRW